ncbi:uncharacterized protein A1O5_00320 [Cladophialophora psammophila CBS 110553]|uniref:Uncharacterized protein n=1 Tax=Cladophialophora psammophila CBS 110553 TaxID=1182543 RepID=W9X6G5_9EURO|nr:uncharacterized protein A1O5_00320 [Cladophialophora psammophila CBS 110553]EXJ75813.1 hypothetical protein A1O5_00320 [Cladophialophora psammophila CBS 110553]
MATRSLRQRSSRYSSPATFGEKEAAPKPAEDISSRNGQQTSLDKWIEPAVRPAVPSFEDTRGLERVGVLENMQPLGTAPSQRLLQKLKLNYVRPSPRPAPAQVDEVVTPVAEPEKVDSASPLEDEAVIVAAAEAEQPEILSDIPLNPQRPSDSIVISSPPRGRPPRRDVAEMPQAATVSPSPMTLSFTPTSHVSPKPLSIQQQLRQDRLCTHVNRAVQEAHQKNTPDLAHGLQKIRDDAQLNPELWNVLEALINKSPSSEQFRVFKRYIKSGVKQHRRESQMSASPYQPSPQIFNDLTSPDYRVRSPKPGHSYANTPLHSTERPPRINLYFNLPRAAATYGLEEAPVSPSTISRSAGIVEPSGKSIHHAANSSPHKRKRSGSVSTLSSLSSAPSIPDEVPPPWEPQGEEPAGGDRSRSAGQRQATSQVAAGNRLRSAAGAATQPSHSAPKQSYPEVATSSKTNSNKKFKKSREETEFDIDELSRRKRVYLDDSFHDYNTIPRPESNERDPVNGHPVGAASLDNPPAPVIHPNSLVVPSVALTSPVSAQAPPDNILANGTGRKRRYDEVDTDDLEDITPESSSPGPLLVPPPPGVANAHTRSATPRATRLQPAQKTRKSARVMVS